MIKIIKKKKGKTALTARAIAEELGVSTQPIFTCFHTMEEAEEEVYKAAEKLFHEYTLKGIQEKIPFLEFGMQYIRFAREEPELYRMLFLEKRDEKHGALEEMYHSQKLVRDSLKQIYRIGEEEADRYFRDMWLVVHSLATLIVTSGCPYPDKEIGDILSGFSISMCKAIKEIPGFISGEYDKDAIFRDLITKER